MGFIDERVIAEREVRVAPLTTAVRPDAHSGRPSHWRPSSASLRIRAIAYLMVLDCAALFASFALAAAVRGPVHGGHNWLVFALTLLPIYLVTATNSRAYSPRVLEEPFRAIRTGGQALLLSLGALTLAVFYLKSGLSFPRFTIAIGSSCAAAFLSITRYFYVCHLDKIIGGHPFDAILIRDGDQPMPPGRFSMVIASESFFDPEDHDPVGYDRLARSLATANRVVIACGPERRRAWARALRGANIQGEILIPELLDLAPLGMGPHRESPSVIVATGPLSLLDRGLKRGFDLAIAGTALLLAALPMLLIALWIKLDSKGPVFFRQTRIGRGNEMFRMLKFRSMRDVQGDGPGHRSTARDDDRITRVGRLIRRTSLDELPQLINVIRGHMSIVGPRPHALGSRAADKLFWEVDQRYWDRHATKPGLTGLAQVRGFRGATLVEDDLRNRLRSDLEYLENWSIWRDVKIIFLTTKVVLHRNAF